LAETETVSIQNSFDRLGLILRRAGQGRAIARTSTDQRAASEKR